MEKKSRIIIFTLIIVIGSTIIVYYALNKKQDAVLEEYRYLLLTLNPEELIIEHFRVADEGDFSKFRETLTECMRERGLNWRGSRNTERTDILDIAFCRSGTEHLIQHFITREEMFEEVKVFDVSFSNEYANTIWRYNLVREEDGVWQIQSFGLFYGRMCE